jgi:hypothetical protein
VTDRDVDRKLAEWGPEYITALEGLAGSAGVSPLDLHQRIASRIEASTQTAECLSLEEFDHLFDDRLAQSRRGHLVRCSFCTQILGLMAQPSRAAEATFVAQATGHVRRVVNGRIGFVSGLVTGGVIGAALARITKRKPAAAEGEIVKAQE